jgi:NitT/TauT family transport system permease protein
LSSNTIEPSTLAAIVEEPVPPPRAGDLRPTLAIVAPAIAAGTALLVYWGLPDGQEFDKSWGAIPKWRHPYPLVLAAMLGISLLAGLLQCVWRPLRPLTRHYAPLFAGALGIVCVWDLTTAKFDLLPETFFPGPDKVFSALMDDRSILLESAAHSLRLLLCGYTLGVALGLVTGVIIGWFILARYWGMPVLKLIGPIPATALVPLAMMLPTDAFYCGVALIGYAVWFPMTMLTSSGIANVRLSYLDVARTLGAGRAYLIFRVAIPSAMPTIFIGLLMGLGASFLTLIVAETVGVRQGLGAYLLMQKGNAEYAKVYASLIIMSIFFSTLMTLLFKLRDWVLKWQRGAIKW